MLFDLTDARGTRDLIETGACPFFGEGGLGGLEQADAVSLRIGPRLAASREFSWIRHAQNTPC